MNLKTYRAYTMAEALAAVKEDLGSDASILHTRSYKRGGILGIGRQSVVEVTACEAAESRRTRMDEVFEAKRPAAGQTQAAAKAYQGSRPAPQRAAAAPATEFESRRLDLLSAIESHRRGTDREAQAVNRGGTRSDDEPRQGPPRNPARAPAMAASTPAREAAPNPRPALIEETKPALATPVTSVARRFILKTPSVGPATERPPASAPALGHSPPPREIAPTKSAPSGDMSDELHAIHGMVDRVLRGEASANPGGGVHAMPRTLFDLYLRLVGQELSEELAEQVVSAVRKDLTPAELEDADQVRKAVFDRLSELVAVAEEQEIATTEDGRPLTIALIGPTGVGKTTTLAKLAATFKLRQGKRVGLITCDTYRIAAVEQLRTYANIIGLPLKVVLSPEEMSDACRQLRDCDIVLIDTAGRSQRDRGRLRELARFIEASDPHQVHLVLSSTAGEKVLTQEAEAFSKVRVDRIILTKLDEAVSFGMLVNVVRKVGKQLSFLTTGQEVPADIEPGRRHRLAALMLGEGVPA